MKTSTGVGGQGTAAAPSAPRCRAGLLRVLEIGVCLVLSTVIALGATSAYGYWTTVGGSGAALASTGTMEPVEISALTGGDAPDSTLIPGGTADVILRVTNPNPVPVQVHAVEPAGTIFADAAFPDCAVTGVTFTPPGAPVNPPIVVDPSASLLVHLPGAAAMASTSSSGCQGALFHIPVTLTARQ